ncbi:serine protease, putative [Phytophthora infestans T30-4]|uniref:Serine protease, putative n=1 Tax=Phytophthora infestans (strain T30-4) TaxID=403677 RepID=D0NHV6_PHYIT|nr:serine protease, putative [Phytophthora infestans T30-4]EEY58831.1 serine protease, putative [Phytophthora infestans T30-4]|eukprot:XP_002901304.1 serine protease, putative [Phytophthora infestans T30-4]
MKARILPEETDRAGAAVESSYRHNTFYGHVSCRISLAKDVGEPVLSSYRIEDTDLTPDEENRGFGGSDTDISKYPFVAGLILERTDDEPICGGTLVAPLFVMTSAYCIEPFTNVALLKLEKPSTRKPAPLADINRSDEKCGTMAAAAAGWGYTKEHAVPDTLQVVDVKIILDNECVKYSVNTDVTLCAGTEHGEGVCYGDYGSPLIANGAVVGIASNVSLSDLHRFFHSSGPQRLSTKATDARIETSGDKVVVGR